MPILHLNLMQFGMDNAQGRTSCFGLKVVLFIQLHIFLIFLLSYFLHCLNSIYGFNKFLIYESFVIPVKSGRFTVALKEFVTSMGEAMRK